MPFHSYFVAVMTTHKTVSVLRDFCPHIAFKPSEVRDAAAFGMLLSWMCFPLQNLIKRILATEVKNRTFFRHPKDVTPQKPEWADYMYKDSELSTAPRPVDGELEPTFPQPTDPLPPKNFLYPQAPVFILKETHAYQQGYIYTAPYHLLPRLLQMDHCNTRVLASLEFTRNIGKELSALYGYLLLIQISLTNIFPFVAFPEQSMGLRAPLFGDVYFPSNSVSFLLPSPSHPSPAVLSSDGPSAGIQRSKASTRTRLSTFRRVFIKIGPPSAALRFPPRRARTSCLCLSYGLWRPTILPTDTLSPWGHRTAHQNGCQVQYDSLCKYPRTRTAVCLCTDNRLQSSHRNQGTMCPAGLIGGRG